MRAAANLQAKKGSSIPVTTTRREIKLSTDMESSDTLFLKMCSISLRDFCMDQNMDDVYMVNEDDTLGTVFDKLVDYDVFAMPVSSLGGEYAGMISYKDILDTTLDLFDKARRPIKGSITYASNKIEWRTTLVSEIMNTEPAAVLSCQTLLTGVEALYYGNYKTIAVIDVNTKKVINVLTESMIMKFFEKHVREHAEFGDVAIREIRPYNYVSSINQEKQAIAGFRRLLDEDISAMAIVDDENKIVDVLSVRDLKGIDTKTHTFRWLWNTAGFFKDQIRNKDAFVAYAPITLKPSNTLSDLLDKLQDNFIHRVFITTYSDLLVDVVSESDVIGYVLGLQTSETVEEEGMI